MRFGDYKRYAADLEAGKIVNAPFTDSPKVGDVSRLGQQVSFGRSRYTLVVGTAGSGKTAFVDTNFVLKPYIYWKIHGGPKPYFIYRSMERNSMFKEVKWKAALIYYFENYVIDVPTILGLSNKKRDLNATDKKYLKKYDRIVEDMERDCLDIKDGSRSPEEIHDYAVKVAKQKGTLIVAEDKRVLINDQTVHEFKAYEEKNGVKIYHWDSPFGRLYANETTYHPADDTIINHITDHIGKVTGGNEKKNIDTHAAFMGDSLRDLYLMSIVDIMQLNRSIFETSRMQKSKLTIKMSDLKGSGVPAENADCILGILDPYAFDHSKYEGWNVADMAKFGPTRYRALICPKNTWGIAPFVLSLYFMGEGGWTFELPKVPFTSESLGNGTWRP